MRVGKPLSIELSRTVVRSPECFPARLFPDTSFGEDTQKFYFLWFRTCQDTFGHGFFLFFLSLFFLRQAEIVHTNSQVLRKY